MITRAEIKTLLQITGQTKDILIDALIPIVIDDIRQITNNDFIVDDGYYALSDDFTFTAASAAISCSNSDDLTLLHIASGDDILISGSLRNDGFYPVSTKTANSIIIAAPFTVLNETQPSDNSILIRIDKAYFPKSLKIAFAKMIGFHLEKPQVSGVKAESVGRYSVTYDTDRQYPSAVYEALKPFSFVGVK